MSGPVAASFGTAVVSHLNSVCNRACGDLVGEFEVVMSWAKDAARVQPIWLHLPRLACKAVGGHSACTVPVASAWHLLHCAAHLLDDVADGAFSDLEPSQVVNCAVILIFLAQVSLATPYQSQIEPQSVVSLVEVFTALRPAWRRDRQPT